MSTPQTVVPLPAGVTLDLTAGVVMITKAGQTITLSVSDARLLWQALAEAVQ